MVTNLPTNAGDTADLSSIPGLGRSPGEGKDLSVVYEGQKASLSLQPWRRKWQPSPVFLPGKSHGRRSLVGYSPWGHKESGVT